MTMSGRFNSGMKEKRTKGIKKVNEVSDNKFELTE
jgi:hypothetical protein